MGGGGEEEWRGLRFLEMFTKLFSPIQLKELQNWSSARLVAHISMSKLHALFKYYFSIPSPVTPWKKLPLCFHCSVGSEGEKYSKKKEKIQVWCTLELVLLVAVSLAQWHWVEWIHMCWPLIDISTTEFGSAQIQKSVYKHISQSEIPVTMKTDSTPFLSGIKQGLFFTGKLKTA